MTYRQSKARGFTIVELLIVIVVIAILAAITIVAYNGVQNRAKASSAQSAANTVAKKLESWNAIVGTYPASYCNFVTNTLAATGTPNGVGTAGCTAAGAVGPVEAKLDDPSDVSYTVVTSANGTGTVYLSQISSTGTCVNWWNYGAATPAITTASTTPPSSKVGVPAAAC